MTSALGINNAGQIVGATGTLDPDGVDGFGSEFGFLMDSELNMQEFSVFDAVVTGGFGINEYGDITGFFAADLSSRKEGFVWRSGGEIVRVDVPGAEKTALGGINDSRTFVGVYQEVVTGPDFGVLAQVLEAEQPGSQ